MAHTIDPNQYTIGKNVSCCGVGLHSGRTVNLSIKPAAENSGIRFFRSDLAGNKAIPAHMSKVVDTRLATTIGNSNGQVSTTEHLMAALQGYGIDNANIEIDALEVPIMDGSAAPFLHLLKRAGRKKQAASRKVIKITKEISYQDGDSLIRILPHDGFKISGEIHFDDELIRTQKYSLDLTNERFSKEIARARTFGYVEQVEELWANGLALGGSLENVIAIHWNRKTVLNEDGLRFDDEFIRHKMLDLIGDLALLGHPILGHVIAERSGHTQHLGFMEALIKASDSWEFIELKKDGQHSVIKQVINNTKAAGSKIMPLLTPSENSQVMSSSPC